MTISSSVITLIIKRANSTIFLISFTLLFLAVERQVLSPIFSGSYLANAQNKNQVTAEQLFQRGHAYYKDGQLNIALDSFQQALRLSRTNGDYDAQSKILSLIAVIHLKLNNFDRAIEFSTLALELAKEVQSISLEIQNLANLGIAHKSLGHYLESLDFYMQALEITQQYEKQHLEAHISDLLGNVYSLLGDYQNAISKYEKSLEIAAIVGDSKTQLSALVNLGSAYFQQGELDLALETYQRSLQLAEAARSDEWTARALNNIGTIYHAKGNVRLAIESYVQSLEIVESMTPNQIEVEVLSNLGLAYEDLNNSLQAITYYEQSLARAEAIQKPQSIALSLNNLGHGLFNAGRLIEAETKLRLAISKLESLRPTLNDTYNISLFDTQIYTYSLLQQILAAQDKPEAALEVAEQGRAQAFIDLLAQRTSPQRVDAISNLRRQPLSIETIKNIAREQNATLVEYALVPDDDFKFQGRLRGPSSRIFIWVVKPTGEVVFESVDLTNLLPENTTLKELVSFTRRDAGARGIEDINQAQNCHTLQELCLGDRVVRTDDPVDQYQYEISEIDLSAETVTLYRPDSYLQQPVFSIEDVKKVENAETWHNRLNQLHQILIEPIENDLPPESEDQVIFIPQEELFLVPFPALQDQAGEYLIQKHTISTIPSIQVLANTRQRRLELENQTGAALIVGNPAPMPVLQPELTGAKPLPSLPHSEKEAIQIAQLLNTDALVGTAASETAVKQRLSEARIIHLASHGLYQEEGDALQSKIALASNSDEQDGFLTAEEILDYSLQADLVVLSACDTGRGSITGDGVIGLSRSFIAAGTPSVMVSLWQVPDAATSTLMTQFYQNRQTLNKAQSLRQAMIHMIDQGLEPKDWAAFTLIGEAE